MPKGNAAKLIFASQGDARCEGRGGWISRSLTLTGSLGKQSNPGSGTQTGFSHETLKLGPALSLCNEYPNT